jgi:hypothetical protein
MRKFACAVVAIIAMGACATTAQASGADAARDQATTVTIGHLAGASATTTIAESTLTAQLARDNGDCDKNRHDDWDKNRYDCDKDHHDCDWKHHDDWDKNRHDCDKNRHDDCDKKHDGDCDKNHDYDKDHDHHGDWDKQRS